VERAARVAKAVLAVAEALAALSVAAKGDKTAAAVIKVVVRVASRAEAERAVAVAESKPTGLKSRGMY